MKQSTNNLLCKSVVTRDLIAHIIGLVSKEVYPYFILVLALLVTSCILSATSVILIILSSYRLKT
jgi:hypothetical protein